jgi:predicted TIM-barrel enzyme
MNKVVSEFTVNRTVSKVTKKMLEIIDYVEKNNLKVLRASGMKMIIVENNDDIPCFSGSSQVLSGDRS